MPRQRRHARSVLAARVWPACRRDRPGSGGSQHEADAADITAILDEYPESDAKIDGHDELHCTFCNFETPCLERFENDAADVTMEADAPYLDVLIWMHDVSLSSLSDSITSLAARYTKDVEEARAARETLERLLG